jgi:hypothetical protein
MDFVFVDTLGLDIQFNLAVLRRDTQRYNFYLYQHAGQFYADDGRIGNNRDTTELFNLFFQNARANDADLVMTPEYSCPWDSIYQLIEAKANWPKENKLWAICCESLDKKGLQALRKKVLENEEIILHFEESVLANEMTFMDSLLYIFRVKQGDKEKLLLLLQFKTFHMGVWSGGDVERNNLIQGKTVFIIRDKENSINLFSLICSEAMNFPHSLSQELSEKIGWEDKPFLILNPQFNPSPRHNSFIEFRKFVFEADKKEIISLNWNRRSTILGGAFIEGGSSRSGIYLRSDDIDVDNSKRIKKNHIKGLYYFKNNRNRHSFILNSEVDAFLIASPPVAMSKAQTVQMRRDGPEILSSEFFDTQFKSLTNSQSPIADQHLEYLIETSCTNEFLLNPANCVLEKERLVCLSTGNIATKKGLSWARIPQVYSVNMSDNTEVNCRITFAEDQNTESIQERARYLRAISALHVALTNNPNLPDSLAELRNKQLRVSYYKQSDQDEYKYNVTDSEGVSMNVTIAFLDNVSIGEVGKTFDLLQQLFDRDHMNRKRVVVVYNMGEQTRYKYDETAATITDINTSDNTSIIK